MLDSISIEQEGQSDEWLLKAGGSYTDLHPAARLGILAISREFGLETASESWDEMCSDGAMVWLRFREGEPGTVDDVAKMVSEMIANNGIAPPWLVAELADFPAGDSDWWVPRMKRLQELTWRVLAAGAAAFVVGQNFPELRDKYKSPQSSLAVLTKAIKADPGSWSYHPEGAGGPAVVCMTSGSSIMLSSQYEAEKYANKLEKLGLKLPSVADGIWYSSLPKLQ